MTVTLRIDMPETAFSALRESPESMAHELRVAAAVKWYEVGRVSQGRAAEIAGLPRADFIDALGRYGVSPFQETEEQLEGDVRRCLVGGQ